MLISFRGSRVIQPAIFAITLAFGLTARSEPITQIIAITGDTIPGVNATLDNFSLPILNNNGRVTFRSSLLGTSDLGIVLGSVNTLSLVTQENADAPSNDGIIDFLSDQTALNDNNQVLIHGALSGASNNADDFDSFFLKSGDTLTDVVRHNQPAPDGNGNITSFTPLMDETGRTVFYARLTGTTGGSSDDRGVFSVENGALTQVAREGGNAPDGNGLISRFADEPDINNAGQIALPLWLTGTAGGDSDDRAIFRVASGEVYEVIREGVSSPDGNGTFSSFSTTRLNDAGQSLFYASLDNTLLGDADDNGIFLESSGIISVIARQGQTAPDANGTFNTLNAQLNDAGTVSFLSIMDGTIAGDADDRGIYMTSGAGLIQIAREGDRLPNNDDVLVRLDAYNLNNAERVLFIASITGDDGITTERGIYLGGESGLIEVAREGQPLAGSTIDSLQLANNPFDYAIEHNGFNDRNQVAYLAYLADGRQAVVLWSLPEPGTLGILLTLAGGIMGRSRRPESGPGYSSSPGTTR